MTKTEKQRLIETIADEFGFQKQKLHCLKQAVLLQAL